MKSSKSTWTIVLGLFFLTIGIIILLDNLNIVYFYTVWSFIWPLLLIVFGLILIFRNRTYVPPKVKDIKIEIKEDGTKHEYVTSTTYGEHKEKTSDSYYSQTYVDSDTHQSNFFGELNYTTENKNFKGLNVSNIFGDINLDISHIDIESEEQILNVSGIFGSIKIKIPKDIPVKFIGSNIAGSVKFMDQNKDGVLVNLNSQSDNYNLSSKKLLIRATVIFGEIVAE